MKKGRPKEAERKRLTCTVLPETLEKVKSLVDRSIPGAISQGRIIDVAIECLVREMRDNASKVVAWCVKGKK